MNNKVWKLKSTTECFLLQVRPPITSSNGKNKDTAKSGYFLFLRFFETRGYKRHFIFMKRGAGFVKRWEPIVQLKK